MGWRQPLGLSQQQVVTADERQRQAPKPGGGIRQDRPARAPVELLQRGHKAAAMAAPPRAHHNHPGLIGIQRLQAPQPWRLKQGGQLLRCRRSSSWQPAEIGMQRLIKGQVEVHRPCRRTEGVAHGRLS